jgi:hypothetical protein
MRGLVTTGVGHIDVTLACLGPSGARGSGFKDKHTKRPSYLVATGTNVRFGSGPARRLWVVSGRSPRCIKVPGLRRLQTFSPLTLNGVMLRYQFVIDVTFLYTLREG